MPAVCLEGPPACPSCSARISSLHFCKTASVQAPCFLFSLQSTLTLQPENFLMHQSDHITPPLKALQQLCQVQSPQPGWHSLSRLSLGQRLSPTPQAPSPKVLPLASRGCVFQVPGWFNSLGRKGVYTTDCCWEWVRAQQLCLRTRPSQQCIHTLEFPRVSA